MPPYVVRQGDYLLSIAYQVGADPEEIWNDPSNASLRALRPDPNLLFPGDVLELPDPTPTSASTLTSGTTNSFVSNAPTTTVSVKFVAADGTPYASMAFTVAELEQLTGLQTDASGVATFQVPVTLSMATVVFTDTNETRPLAIGGMDPIDTLSGIFKRLQNLGCITSGIAFDPNNLDLLRVGLMTLKESQTAAAPDSTPPSGPVSSQPTSALTPGPDSSPSSTPPPAPSSSTPGGGAASAPGSGPGSAPGSTPSSSPDSAPPSSAPSSSPAPIDDAGLSDDGTLSDDLKALLLQAYGH
jgi:hypothetical protein